MSPTLGNQTQQSALLAQGVLRLWFGVLYFIAHSWHATCQMLTWDTVVPGFEVAYGAIRYCRSLHCYSGLLAHIMLHGVNEAFGKT